MQPQSPSSSAMPFAPAAPATSADAASGTGTGTGTGTGIGTGASADVFPSGVPAAGSLPSVAATAVAPMGGRPEAGIIDTRWVGTGVVMSDSMRADTGNNPFVTSPQPLPDVDPAAQPWIDTQIGGLSPLEEDDTDGQGMDPFTASPASRGGRTSRASRAPWIAGASLGAGDSMAGNMPMGAGMSMVPGPSMSSEPAGFVGDDTRWQPPRRTGGVVSGVASTSDDAGAGVSAGAGAAAGAGAGTGAGDGVGIGVGIGAGGAGPRRQKLPWRDSWRGQALRARFVAAGCHLGLSVLIACLVLVLVYAFWYAGPLAAVAGVGTILVLLLAVDVSLGPIMTFLVFDRRKKSLPADLALIGVMQLAALGYGLHTVEAGRPHYLVFVKDRFEAVSKADLQAEDLQKAAGNPAAATALLGPVWAAAKPPADEKARQDVLMESALGGRDLQHFPQWYESLDNQRDGVKNRALDLDTLRRLNSDGLTVLDEAIRDSGLSQAQIGYLPLKGEESDASVLVSREDGHVITILPLKPW